MRFSRVAASARIIGGRSDACQPRTSALSKRPAATALSARLWVGQSIAQRFKHGAHIESVSIDKRGLHLASLGGGTVHLFHRSGQKSRQQWADKAARFKMTSVDFDASGERLIIGYQDGRLRLVSVNKKDRTKC